MRTLNHFATLASALLLTACAYGGWSAQTASIPEVGRWLNGNTPVINILLPGTVSTDSVIAYHQNSRMWKSPLQPVLPNRYLVSTTSPNGSERVNVLLIAYRGGRFIGYSCNYYTLQGGQVGWAWGGRASQPGYWFVDQFSMNPDTDPNPDRRCKQTSGY